MKQGIREAMRSPRTREAAEGALLGGLGAVLAGVLFGGMVMGGRFAPGMALCMAIGGALGASRHRWLLAAAGWAGLLLYATIAFTPLLPTLVERWVRVDLPSGREHAVIVLGAGSMGDSTLTSQGTDRLLSGLLLAEARRVDTLLTVRMEAEGDPRGRGTDVDVQRLIALADYRGHHRVISPVLTTLDEARTARRLFPVGSAPPPVFVVTSPVHTRRACAIFEREGFVVTCTPARSTAHRVRGADSAGDRLETFRLYLYERLGMIKWWLVR